MYDNIMYCVIMPERVNDHKYGLLIEKENSPITDSAAFDTEMGAIYAVKQAKDSLKSIGIDDHKFSPVFLISEEGSNGNKNYYVNLALNLQGIGASSIIDKLGEKFVIYHSDRFGHPIERMRFYSCGNDEDKHPLNGAHDSEDYSLHVPADVGQQITVSVSTPVDDMSEFFKRFGRIEVIPLSQIPCKNTRQELAEITGIEAVMAAHHRHSPRKYFKDDLAFVEECCGSGEREDN